MQERTTDGGVYWLNVRYTDEQCPGMREILASAPMDQQSALVRGILFQWCLMHKQSGTLEQAMINVLNGPGVNGRRRRKKDESPGEAAGTSAPKRPAVAKPAQVPTPTAPTEDRLAHAPPLQPEQPEQPEQQAPASQAVSSPAADRLFDMFE